MATTPGPLKASTLQLTGAMALDGGTIRTHGISIPAATPSVVTSVLYSPDGAALYYNGSPLATGSSISGTTGKLAKFTAATTLGDSIITESGTTVTVANTLNATSLGGTLTTAAQTAITSVGTLTGGATGAGFTVALGTSTITGTIPAANVSGSYTSITGVGTLTAGATGAGFTIALSTSTVTGTLSTTRGGTGQDTSGSTGIAQVAAGTWSVSSTVAAATTFNSTVTWSGGTTIITTDTTIRGNTADASDNLTLALTAGGALSSSRGAAIVISGNEASNTGGINYVAGNVAGGKHVFQAGGSQVAQITSGFSVGTTADAGSGNIFATAAVVAAYAGASTGITIYSSGAGAYNLAAYGSIAIAPIGAGGQDLTLAGAGGGGDIVVTLGTATTGTDVVLTASNELRPKTSSGRFKTNKRAFKCPTGVFDKLKPCQFDYTGDNAKDVHGFYAEELYELWPDAVNLDADGLPYSNRNDALIALLVHEVQKLKKAVKSAS